MRTMFRGILALMLIVTFLTGTMEPAVAQSSPQLEQLKVDLWPEYDREEQMLVIYRGTLSKDTPLPATLTFRLPARVGGPHAVAYDDGGNNLLTASYSSTIDGDWLLITFEIPTPTFHLEFYDSLTRIDEQRRYSFLWPGDYTVNEFNISLLPPFGATELRTEPVLSPPLPETDSVTYWGALGSLTAGQESQITVTYDGANVKVGEAISLPITEDQDAQETNNNTVVIVVLIASALLLVIGGAIWYIRQQKPQPEALPRPQQRQTRHKGRPQRRATGQEKPSAAGYCTQCGKPLQHNDRFCSSCGTQVKGKIGRTE